MGKGIAPSFQFYAAEFLAKTAFLNEAEVGCVIRIMANWWALQGELTREELDQITKNLTPESRQKVLKKIRLDGEHVLLDDLDVQRNNQEAFRKMQTEKSRKYWKGKRKSRQPADDPVDIQRDGPTGNQRETSYSYSDSEASPKNQNKKEKSDHDKKKELEKMEIEEIAKSDPGVVHTDHLGGDTGQQTNGDSPPDRPEINVSMDDRPEGVRKFLENIKAPRRAAPIVGTWGEDDPHPTI
jgi:hypothetical protein